MRSTFPIAKVRGIAIGAHWSWLLIVALLISSLASALFPSTYPGLEPATYWWMGTIAAVLFFLSILLHELGHSLWALREGMRIDGITLWLFGGVARFSGMFPSAGAEFRIAIAGPVVSLVLTAAFLGSGVALSAAGAPPSWVGVADYLARINLIVVAFNLVPALPLDGGRVLRAWLWSRQGSFSAATFSAARAGMAFAALLAAVGVLNLWADGGTAGLWLLFLGWFLWQAAQAERSIALVQRALAGRRAADLMTREPATVPPEVTVDDFLGRIVRPRGHAAYPVVEEGRTLGVVTVDAAAGVAPHSRASQRVSDVMVPLDDVARVAPDADALETLERLQEDALGRVLVHDDGRLVGIVSLTDVMRALTLERRVGASDPRARSAGWALWVPVVIAMLAAAALLYHPPFVVLEPGATVDVSEGITIRGTDWERNQGRYLLTSIHLARPTALGLLWSALAHDRRVVALGDLVPEGQTPSVYFEQQRKAFVESRRVAAAAAARAAGMDVAIEGTGAIVRHVVPTAPAADVLRPGDVILEIDGNRVDLATAVQHVVRSKPTGSRFRLTIERGTARRTVTVTTAALPELDGGAGIGVVLATRDLTIDLPFEISFSESDIAGPSGGLAYALAISDMLQEKDFALGVVGASGTIDALGRVGAVSGLEPKAEALQQAGAELFLVPQSQVDALATADIEVRGVARLEQALRVLRPIAEDAS